MAQRSEDDNDKALWLTLAQSWVRLAELAAPREASLVPGDGEDAPETASAEQDQEID
jgi:hypothetical protein